MAIKKRAAVLAAAACILAVSGCGNAAVYKDGTYEARSAEYVNDDGSEDGNGYGIVKITITDGAVTDCTFATYELDGTLKGEEYGKKEGSIANKDFYNKAQKAVAACSKYAEQLVLANGDLGMVDAISGATINYSQFQEAASEALSKAEDKS